MPTLKKFKLNFMNFKDFTLEIDILSIFEK